MKTTIIKEKHILTHYFNRRNGQYFANAYPKVFFDYLKSGGTGHDAFQFVWLH